MTDFAPSACVVADSISEGRRITTIEVTLQQFALSDMRQSLWRSMVHNSGTSTGAPAADTIRQVNDEPAVPLFWPAEGPGVFGAPPLPTVKARAARNVWLTARQDAVTAAAALTAIGVHDSIVNRLLEPFRTSKLLITATDWQEFLQRPQTLFQPLLDAEVAQAATAVFTAFFDSIPEQLTLGQWHLPYLDPWEVQTLPVIQAAQTSVARCARVAYLSEPRPLDAQEDLAIFQRLITLTPPPPLSLMEHIATPADSGESRTGGFLGWHQFRYLHEQGADR